MFETDFSSFVASLDEKYVAKKLDLMCYSFVKCIISLLFYSFHVIFTLLKRVL